MTPERRRTLLLLLALAALAVLAYLPTLAQPFIEDDYWNISLSWKLGQLSAWHEMMASEFRPRITSIWYMDAAWHAFGLRPAPYYALNIGLHVLCVWLVYALGCWRQLGYRLSAWAAAFFAVYEGHQEAIMWFSACNETLQFLFGAAALVCWLRFLDSGARRVVGLRPCDLARLPGRLLALAVPNGTTTVRERPAAEKQHLTVTALAWYAAAVACFALALASKESAVVFGPLFLLPLVPAAARRRAPWVLPLLAMAALGAWSIFALRARSFRFHDGSFSLHAPIWLVWPDNLARLFWAWGLASLVCVAVWGWKKHRPIMILGLVWAGATLLPYCFLLYWKRVPSRQFYLPSLGAAWIVAAAILTLRERFPRARRGLTAAVVAVMLLANIGTLWTKKRRQFLERAQPTEQLIALARRSAGPIYVRCFPRDRVIAEQAVVVGASRPATDLVWDEAEAHARGATASFCYLGK
jgi:hypothetical protein